MGVGSQLVNANLLDFQLLFPNLLDNIHDAVGVEAPIHIFGHFRILLCEDFIPLFPFVDYATHFLHFSSFALHFANHFLAAFLHTNRQRGFNQHVVGVSATLRIESPSFNVR